MATAHAHKLPENLPQVDPQTPNVSELQLADDMTLAGASPARDMQNRLKSELERSDKTSARQATAMLLVVCLATWVAGFALYATL